MTNNGIFLFLLVLQAALNRRVQKTIHNKRCSTVLLRILEEDNVKLQSQIYWNLAYKRLFKPLSCLEEISLGGGVLCSALNKRSKQKYKTRFPKGALAAAYRGTRNECYYTPRALKKHFRFFGNSNSVGARVRHLFNSKGQNWFLGQVANSAHAGRGSDRTVAGTSLL